MRTQQRAMGHSPGLLWVLLITVLISFGGFTNTWAQSSNSDIRLKIASPEAGDLSTASSEGVPERGDFQFRYSYSGESIDADIILFKNGSEVARASGLSPVANKLLGDFSVKKGDEIVISTSFRGSGNSATLGPSNIFGHPAGLWYSYGSGLFYSVDQKGNIIEVFGNWNFSLTLTPPWNAITVEAQPSKLSPGGTSNISLQPVESPAEPVIIPDQTYINLQTNVVGDLLGGLGLPAFGLRYTQGFANAPWGLLKNTDKVFEVLPDSLLPMQFDSLQIPVVAYSPYDTGINGSTDIEVTKEGDLDIILDISGSYKAWPAPRYKSTDVDKIIENIVVTVTKSNGEPAPNKPVVIEATWAKDSGGHHHTDNKVPPKNKMGMLSVSLDPPLSPQKGNGIVSTKTDKDGKIYLSYTNPEFGGKINLVATLQAGTKDSDSKQVVSRVPSLKKLEPGQYYELVGAPDNHKGTNDPCRWPPGSNHFSNHWGIPELNQNIKEITADFDSLHPGTKLRINDMSLSKGGLFDFNNNWSKPHKSHRVGTNADIGFKAIGPDGGCQEDINLRDLRQRIYKTTQTEPYVESNHYHIYTK